MFKKDKRKGGVMTDKQIISAYMAEIGRKGGKVKGRTKARDSKKMKAAIERRWEIQGIKEDKAEAMRKFSPEIMKGEELLGVVIRSTGEQGALIRNKAGKYLLVNRDIEMQLSKRQVEKHL